MNFTGAYDIKEVLTNTADAPIKLGVGAEYKL